LDDVLEVQRVRKYKVGYEVRTKLIDGERYGGQNFVIKSAYTPEGHYIGSPRDAHRLVAKYGIKPEPVHTDCTEANSGRGLTCSIGFSERDQKWYGWSHRALHGFAIGDVVDSEDHLCACSGWTDKYLVEHPEADVSLPVGFVARTLEDAKRMAIAFAEAVG